MNRPSPLDTQGPQELQPCISSITNGERHRTCCCESEQRCLIAVRYATRRMIAAGLGAQEVYLRLAAGAGWSGVDEAEQERGAPFDLGWPGGVAEGLDVEP
jgi:hypothetical protein